MRKIYAQLLFLILPFSLFSQIQLGPNLEGDTYEDLFGNTVAISGDGNRIIASGPGNSVAAHRAGMAKVMEWDGNNWNQLGSNFLGILSQDQMNGVAISGNGNTVAVSASFGGQNEEGYFRAYNWDGTNWNLQGGIVYGDTLIEGLGSKIELSEDGTRLVVAALSYRQSRGRVKVFEWNGSNWTAIGNSIVGSRSHQLLGYDVAISGDGQRIAVGLPSFQLGGGMGRVDLYQWDSGSWLPMGNGIAFDGIGTSIDLSHDGSSVIVGDPRNQGNGGIEGAAKVYQWDGTSWLPRGTTIVGDSPFDLFGYDVAINGDGDRIAVSAINHDLNSQALAFETGQVKVYDWSGLDWIHIGQDIEGESFNDSLGFSLGLSKSGTRMVAGAPSHDHFNINQARGMTKVFYVGNFVQHGTVRLDENNNCIADSTENTQAGVSISVEGNNFQWTTNTDFWGRYAVLLDTGLFKIKVNPSGYPYSFPCPDSQLISIDSSTTNLADIDFVLQDSISCPYLTVEIASPFIRRCFPGFYNLEYCNLGSQDAPGAYVDVELDSNLTFISSNGTLLSQNGQWLRFDLDTLKAGECGRIRVSFEENCQAVPDQMVCSRANIYPDSLCTASIPNVEIEKSCRPDSVVFEIKNLANAFGAPQAYFILNQAGIVDSGSIQLGMSDSTFIAVNDTGTSQAYQFVLSPNDPTHYHNPGWFTCDTHALITSMLFPTETVQAFSDVDCQSNIGSYDPNDKTAIPPAGDILPASPLTYTIRFQNTGTDTAFFINILDTLSQNLDINTLEVQVASHPYVFEVISQNPAVVRFRFDPIFLPDSTTDLEGSNGFVKFG
ncbi:MAG: hypothetical protein MRZ79_19355, partial [Bacteroidia bacterium]|nr:hypothetical protein [Bacteroidia bacterium]